MNITVEIKAPELVSAIESLAKALGQAPVAPVKEETKKPIKEEPKKEEPKKETPVKEEPKKDIEPKKNEAPEISLEVVRTKLAEFASAGQEKQLEVKDALSRFGVRKLTDVDPADYKELLELVGLSV